VSLFTSQANPIRRTAPSLANPCYWGIRANSVHLSLAIEIKSPEHAPLLNQGNRHLIAFLWDGCEFNLDSALFENANGLFA
jgi:hypothetical protein